MEHSYEVIVVGATASGVCAAVAAAEKGASVALVSAGSHVGGMMSGGLGYTDTGDTRVIGGMAARFRSAVADYYGVPVGRWAGPEPHAAEDIFLQWLMNAGVALYLGEALRGLELRDAKILAITTDTLRLEGGVFIDATYEGDLLDMAGVPSAVGRESTGLYHESLAGRREVVPGMHVMPAWVSPYVGDELGERGAAESLPFLPQIRPEGLAPVGSGDGGVMSYGYRVCLTKAADRIAFEKSSTYSDDYWELGRRLFRLWEKEGRVPPAGRLIGLAQNLPGEKADGNSLGPFSLSVLDGSAWEYPTANRERREEIRLHHLHHAQDFLWFLTHDESVPASVRDEMVQWGLPADEFRDTDHLPHQLYVREARRMKGANILTQADLQAGSMPNDTIAMGSYHIDIREVQRTWQIAYEHPNARGFAVTEGYLSVAVPPYGIGYSNLVPQRDDCKNLIVPVCISASQIAFASVRMEVQYQMMGQAAGVAAALAANSGKSVQDVDVEKLQDLLATDGQVLRL
jgi:hypothetical protein